MYFFAEDFIWIENNAFLYTQLYILIILDVNIYLNNLLKVSFDYAQLYRNVITYILKVKLCEKKQELGLCVYFIMNNLFLI